MADDNRRAPVTATYRLQLGPTFTFADAAAAVPYIARLGASHLYLSPIWEAVPGSTHGYDVIDHGKVRGELGGLAGLLELRAAANAHGLGLIADIVPNHLGVEGARQPWWRDVLRLGMASPFARYFDIDWDGHAELPSGVLVLPVLGGPYGDALEAGELKVAFDGSELTVAYYENAYPLTPESHRDVLGIPPPDLRERMADPATFAEFVTAIEALKGADPSAAVEAVATLARRDTAVREWIDAQAAAMSGEPGDPESWDALDALLGRQHYRLAFWRVSGEQINYRRFFDINTLAAVRQEEPEVFAATHALVVELVRDGILDGLRVDHIDGLYDPARYLSDLASACPGVPIWVEKIFAEAESLPGDWQTAGATGYEFLAKAGGLFIDEGARSAISATYRDVTGEREGFARVSGTARRGVAESAFAGEVTVLATQLFRLAQQQRRYRDVPLRALRDALEAVLASFPVYRTYFELGEPRPIDAELIESAVRAALKLELGLVPLALDFLCRVLLLETGDEGDARAASTHFRRRFQQLSGPVMAKGMEDTTFFRYNRLLALNEVGAHPEHFGTNVAAFHTWATERASATPLALNATSTHDTKRSEDARMRLSVLSEVPAEWQREVKAWARLNDGKRPPELDANTEYYLYQSLVASFEGSVRNAYVERIAAHLQKATREAKRHTSWTAPEAAHENAVETFIRAILDERRSKRFLARLASFVERIEPAARMNSLALTALKCLAPGIPDIYQGSEAEFLALTDPDNRRPVDFVALARALDRCEGGRPPMEPGLRKTWLVQNLLALRATHPDLFADGAYEPLAVTGEGAERIVAFARSHARRTLVVAVPRLPHAFIADGELRLPADLELELPGRGPWEDVLLGGELTQTARDFPLAERLARFPVLVLLGGNA